MSPALFLILCAPIAILVWAFATLAIILAMDAWKSAKGKRARKP